jgi:mRNA interferase HicA
MKQRDLIRLFENNGWTLERYSKHIIYKKDGQTEEIPHHKEINERLAKAIIKRRGLK